MNSGVTVFAAEVAGRASFAAAPAHDLVVDEMDRRGAIRALESAWEALASYPANNPGGAVAPFAHPAWFAVTAAHLCEPPRALKLLVAHRQGQLAGVLPLLAEKRRLGGIPARVLRSLSDDHSQRFDLCADGEGAVAALWRHLARDPSWDVLELRDVVEGSRGAALLQELAAAEGCPVSVWESQRSPYIPLPATVEELERNLDAKFRANLRRRMRNLAKLGEVKLERITGEDVSGAALAAALDEGFELERSGWKGEEGSAIACDPDLKARYRALARVFANRGELSLYFLRLGGRRVAFHYAIETGGVYYLFKPGFDESLRKYGLGHLLLWEVARDLVQRGAREIDLLGEDMDWKREWTDKVRAHRWLYVYRPTVRGRALHAWKAHAIPAIKTAAAALRARFGRPAPTENATDAANTESSPAAKEET